MTIPKDLAPIKQPGAVYTREVPPADPGEQFVRQVQDASLLLEHASVTGKTIADTVAGPIYAAQQMLKGGEPPAPNVLTEFSRAYRQLSATMSGVTAVSLRATSDEYGSSSGLLNFLFFRRRHSEAKRWSQTLWIFTVVFALAILVAENYDAVLARFFALDESTSGATLTWHAVNVVLQSIVPFLYGGIGAAAYLLRSAHVHIRDRTFDPLYVPEYMSRLLVGIIAGGTIQVLIDTVTTDGAVVDLGAAAVAFIAGYNADLLFRTVERLSEALLPKVDISSMRRPSVAPVTGLSVTELAELANKADPDTRASLLALIAKIRERV